MPPKFRLGRDLRRILRRTGYSRPMRGSDVGDEAMIKLFCAPHARSLASHITLEEARALHGGARPLRTSHPRWPP
jgi:hypothetical protein